MLAFAYTHDKIQIICNLHWIHCFMSGLSMSERHVALACIHEPYIIREHYIRKMSACIR